ncbi:polyhydroxyalkanoate synthesis regulator DNA-binding domain-containing protein [soil metagenome]
MPLIKRYPNRKLYDTEAKRYVTLDQLTALIQQGADVQVVDHESGEELTSLTLAQIILEQEKKRAGFLPLNLLTDLIRSGGSTLEQVLHAVQENLGGALNPRENGQELVAQSESQIGKLLEQGKLSLEQAQALLKVDERIANVLHRLNVPTHDDVVDLQMQVAALNEKLATLLAAQPPEPEVEKSNGAGLAQAQTLPIGENIEHGGQK